MDVDRLAEQLRDPDPHVRVATLRILAMVEETRALEAVRWIFMNDPEPGVREVANWAGRLLWAAHQRGHTTQRAVEALYEHTLSREDQEAFLASLGRFDLRHAKNRETQQYAQDQLFRRQLDDAMRGDAVVEKPDVPDAPLPLPPPVPELRARDSRRDPPPASGDLSRLDDLDDAALLDVGLTELFRGE